MCWNESPISLVVSHRTHEFDGVSLIGELRRRNATVPILMMSGIDRRGAALAAGASAFLTYEEWLMVGNHVADLLTKTRANAVNSTAPFALQSR